MSQPIWVPFADMEGGLIHLNIGQIESFRQAKLNPVRKDSVVVKTVVTMISGHTHDVPMSLDEFIDHLAGRLQELVKL
jgi:hypothetical protein